MTTLSLYIRIQVNILGRHLYVDIARGIRSSHMLEEEADHIDKHDQQEFLAITDYLSNYGLTTLILHIQSVATEVLNGKQLRDPFNSTTLGETIMKILDIFMGNHHWVRYFVPKNDVSYKRLKPTSSNNFETLPEISKLDQLMVEAREVLSSADFMNLMEVSLR
ncbi:hypothetical protein GIB67_040932 [Kingdonia uniflora]|uniref:Uncharacterized protein n=1 Tax=Kingdonia uniflora TaxID=39325 RepID=A0A7J7PDI0_9MAGN|nr:hypothetical protein GIB67_040932 [Kingdonia uniflora]